MSEFDKFLEALEQQGLDVHPEALDTHSKNAMGQVFGNVTSFLMTTNMVPAESMASIESINSPIATLNSETSLTQVGIGDLVDLCQNCAIPAHLMKAAVESVGLCLSNYQHGYDIATHLETAPPSASHGKFEMRELSSIYPTDSLSMNTMTPEASIEAFGTYVNNTITDAKVAVTVSLLRFHRSALHRLIPNVPYDSNVVMFKVDHLEMYDLTKSRDLDSSVRDDGKHRTAFIELYNDPSPANTSLKPILLRTANDAAAPNNKLIAENVIKINTEVNMFSLSIDAGQIGYQNIDYTDLVGDNVRVKALFVEVTDGTTTETLRIDTLNRTGARLVLNANNTDSADRSSAMRESVAFDVDTEQSNGTASVLLNGLTPDGLIRFDFNVAANINLRTSLTSVLGTGSTELVTKSGDAPVAGDVSLAGSLTFTLVGAEMDANFSEENIRKTTKSMRILTKQLGYEIPGSNNVMVQYSLTQTRPEVVIDGLTKLLSIGADDRGINLMIDTLNSVYDQIQSEKALAATQNYTSGVGQAFVCGQRVRPSVYLGSIDIGASVVSMKTSELQTDARAVAEKALLEIIVSLMNQSFYQQELAAGEKLNFSVLTSGWILSSLLNTPHFRTHLDFKANEGDLENSPIEFRRVLPNGAVLNIVTTTFNYMTDKMLIIPTRPGSPRDTMNFARNAERGTYVANAAISQQSAVYRQLIANAREIPIVTNPVGALITVSGLSHIFDGEYSLGL